MSLVAMTGDEVVVLGVIGRAIRVDSGGDVRLGVEATVEEVEAVVDEVEVVFTEVFASPFSHFLFIASFLSFLGLNPDLC
jgi:hypothetical protein